MGLFSYIRSVYSLDTIDTRFVNNSSTPYQQQIDPVKQDDSAGPPQGVPVKLDGKGNPIAQPSKWKTPEFYFYYFVFLTIVPYMFWIAYDVSRPSDPNYHKYEHLLSDGWVPGHKIDVSDNQYRTFRENIPYLALLVIFHPLARKLYNKIRPLSTYSKLNPKDNQAHAYASATEADARLEQRVSFDFGFAIIFLLALHALSAPKIGVILYLNYQIATRLPKKYIPLVTWVFNIGTLFANELARGYKYQELATFLDPSDDPIKVNWGSWLDGYGGIMPRWEVLFNITVLRMISFNIDYCWSLDKRANGNIEKKQLDMTNLSERDRIAMPAKMEDYSFRNFVAYTLYAPLYLAGPIFTFNDYISQLRYRPASISNERTIKYAVRFFGVLLSIELLLHFDYCVAISKGNPTWTDYTPKQLSLLSYFNLHVLWLKLLLPWRLFRLWALIDGIDPPENMLRCLSDNPSTIKFWRGWHRSYNRWLIRYVYIPLGGGSTKGRYGIVGAIINYLVVFTFVALWHDISLNLLYWAWLIVLFMLPEIVAGMLFPRRKWENRLTAYRCLCALGAVGNLMMMMVANLVGFAVGIDGLMSIVHGIFRDVSGFAFLLSAVAVLFVGIQVMFELREHEMRQGIFLKC